MIKIDTQNSSLKKRLLILTITALIFISCIVTSAQVFASRADNITYNSKKVRDKNQYISGPCWAFAHIATLETFLSNKGILENSLSEKHLLSWANKGCFTSGWNIPIEHGGNSIIANGYFTCGIGPVFEKDCPYNTLNTKYNSRYDSLQPQYFVKGIKKVESNIRAIKEAVAEYGAVTVMYPVANNRNHAVSVIGWDNNTKKWLVKDSNKNPNYTWLPFATEFNDCSCITNASKFNPRQKTYQHDEYGVFGQYTAPSKFTVANVFDFNGDEFLDSIMIYSYSTNARFNLYCAPVISDGTPNGDSSTWKKLYSGIIPYEGYATFELNHKIHLKRNKYAIIIQMEQTPNSPKPSLGSQMSTRFLNLKNEKSKNKSFIMHNNSFYDVKNKLSGLNDIEAFSIKAITIKG